MRYLCLIYNDEGKADAMSRSEREAVASEALAYREELKRRKQFVAAQALQPIRTATTVRVRTGRLSITEGPVANAREQLTGFLLIDARDLNEVIRVASRMPEASLGSIEVRPIRDPNLEDEALA